MKHYNITLNNEKLKDDVLKEAIYNFILNGSKFSLENDVLELEVKDDVPIEEGIAKSIAELSSIAKKVIMEEEVKKESSKYKPIAKEIKEITDFAKEAENVEDFKQKIRSFLEEKGIKEENNPMSFKDWQQVIDSVVELALKKEEISWKTIKAGEKQQHRLNATIRRRLTDENTNFSALQFLRIVAEKVTKYFPKDEEQNNMEISNNEVQNIESQIESQNVEVQDIEARRELEKFLESKLTNLNVDEDSVTVKATKILKLMEFQSKKDREIMRKFLTLVIRPIRFSLDRVLTKLSLEFDCTVFEIRILLSEIINKIIPQTNIVVTMEDFCIIIRKIANSSIREREREIER